MLGALLIFVFIIWWTMFSGRKGGEAVHTIDDATANDGTDSTTNQTAGTPTSETPTGDHSSARAQRSDDDAPTPSA